MKPILIASVLALGLVSATISRAQSIVYEAFLSGPNESPANASPATGFALVTIDTLLNTMMVEINWTGLTGTTTASHIHAATTTPGSGTAGVATTTPYFAGFPIGVTSGTYSNTLDLTSASSYNPAYVTANGGTVASAEAALLAAIAGDRAYLNIHSSLFGGGEIRGFLTPVPEPGTLALMGLGIAGLVIRARKNKSAPKP